MKAKTARMKLQVSKVLGLIACLTGLISTAGAQQYQEGVISYNWQQPNKILFSGSLKPAVTVGDSVVITLSTIGPHINLRPRVTTKKKGGFLGIGAKRVKEIHPDYKSINEVNTHIGINGTKWAKTSNEVKRVIVITEALLEDDPILAMNKEYFLEGFLAEGGKNLSLGYGDIKVSLEIDSKNRITKVIDYLHKQKPSKFSKIQQVIEAGNLIKQYSSELADALFDYYTKYQPTALENMKKDFYEYLIVKAPDNVTIRSGLAKAYLSLLQFNSAKAEAKKVIEDLEAKNEETLEEKDKLALGGAYATLGEVEALRELGTQHSAYKIAATNYGLAAKYFRLANSKGDFEDATMKQVKCLQYMGTIDAMLEASKILEKFVNYQL